MNINSNKITNYIHLMRLNQPTGILLLLWPCWWGLVMASSGMPKFSLILIFLIGSIIMRTAGCIINDLWDYKIDAQVERTKNRPLASGALTKKQALYCLAILLVFALGLLATFNKITITLGIIAMTMVLIYPLMKRITYWPQIFLGLTFNFGALMSWTAVTGRLDTAVYFLYAAGIFWTLGYDTIYANMDKKDDLLIGVKSSAIALGEKNREGLHKFYLYMFTCLFCSGYLAKLNILFYLGLLVVGAHLYWQVTKINLEDPQDCMSKFVSNRILGGMVLIAIILGKL